MSKTKFSQQKRARISARDGSKCWICGKPCEDSNLELDHVVPRFLGGSNDDDNLRVCCASCNAKKGTDNPNSIFFDSSIYSEDRVIRKFSIPKSMYEQIAFVAQKEHLSVNSLLIVLLKRGMYGQI